MNFSAWSIRNPIPAVLLFILLTLAGLLSFRAMEIQQFMDVDLPLIRVTATLPGASPAQMETEVARKIENIIATLRGLRHVYSKSVEGTAIVTAEFRIEKPSQEALDEVRDAIARIRADLPGALKDPVIEKMEMADSPILTYTVASARMDEENLSWFVDNEVSRAMLGVRGVGAISRVGGVTRELRVEPDPIRLLALNATVADISRQLKRIQQEAAGGRADLGGAEQAVRAVATVGSAAELAAMDIVLSDGRRVRLDQIATITDTVAERRSAALLNGQPVVGFEIVRSRGTGAVAVAEAVRIALDKLRAAHPDVTIVEAFNFVDPVIDNYHGSMSLLVEGAVLAVLVVWLFLRDGRATLVSATALPLSAIPTFAVMYLLGFSLNIVTLLALSLVIGILVDDAIVEVENIMRHLRMGKTPFQAAMEAADEIGLAVIATTFTLIAVFLPTAFMDGIPGKFFVEFGWTAAIAVFFSLVVARLLTPMMAAYLLRAPKTVYDAPRWLDVYIVGARWCLLHRLKTLFATALFFVGSFALLPLLQTGFIPPDDLSQTQIYLSLPPGSTFDESLAAAEQARAIVERNPNVTMVYTAVGGGKAGGNPFAAGVSEVVKSTLTINLTPRTARAGIRKQQIENELREALAVLPGVRVKIGLGTAKEKYELVLAGENGSTLAAHVQIVERELRGIPGIGNVTTSASLVRPELVVRPDFARMADLGVTSADLADTLRVATSGDYDQYLAKLDLEQRQVPIVVKLPFEARQDLALLSRLSVPGARGPVALGNVADLDITAGPAEVDRYDRLRNVRFEIELNGLPMGEVQKRIAALPSLLTLPPGIIQAPIGDAQAMQELFASFGLAMAAGVLCIYFVLVLLFKNFVQPATILVALVLSVPGAFLALFLTNTALSMPSLLGLIMLMGIATKNAILLIDYAIIAMRERGLNRDEALLDACRKRARPIIMTTMAMGAGMLPIAVGLGTDPSFRAPMAIVVIGGLITSTFLSLLVVPVVFSYVDDIVQRFSSKIVPVHRFEH